jgi:hypothetical protein
MDVTIAQDAEAKRRADMDVLSLAETRLLEPADVMRLFGFAPNNRSGFWQFVRRNHIPFIQISARTIRFEERTLRLYLDQRTVK